MRPAVYEVGVRYELLLQAAEPGSPYDVAKVDAALLARGVAGAPSARRWALKHGEVEVGQVVEGGRTVATELKVPLSDRLDLVRELVVAASALAGEVGVMLCDPQLARAVAARDEGLVADQFLRTAKYAGEMMGVSEAVAASYSTEDVGALKPGTKVLLGLIAVLVVMYLVVDRLLP